jgi:serine/threonine protein kinase
MDSYFKFEPNKNINNFLILREINRGSYGSVLEALNLKNSCKYALKIIRNEERFRKQCHHEINILKNLNNNNNNNKYPIIKYYGYFDFEKHFCLIFELLSDINLADLMKKTNYNGLELKNVVKFSRQIAHAVKFIHNYNYIHCDLKPQNIVMVNSKKCKIKILDFGISRVDKEINNYFYVQTLYYRSPEIFEKKNYNKMIDIWSLGCIIGELYTGFPLIYGKDDDSQYKLIKNIKNIIINLKTKNNDNLENLKDVLSKCLTHNFNYRYDIHKILNTNFLKLNNRTSSF